MILLAFIQSREEFSRHSVLSSIYTFVELDLSFPKNLVGAIVRPKLLIVRWHIALEPSHLIENGKVIVVVSRLETVLDLFHQSHLLGTEYLVFFNGFTVNKQCDRIAELMAIKQYVLSIPMKLCELILLEVGN